MLNTLIRAAGFLYSHSPAPYVTSQCDTLIVRGGSGNELADALFTLLFTTAFRPGGTIRLIRLLPAGAKEAELEFICRNEEGIGVFARHGYTDNEEKRPLSICFLDDSEFDTEKELNRIAWAVDLEGGKIPAGGECYTEQDIPEISPDEENCEALRVARRVHTAYTAGWNSRYTEEQISADLYGTEDRPAEKTGWYCLRSSLRLAVSVPWKLAAVGIRMDENIPETLYRKLNEPDGKNRDMLAWQEHRSWQAFMTLDGWRMPTPEEMSGYLFRDGNDHRNRKEKWHPCLCDLEQDDWNEPHEYSLKDTPVHEWSMVQMSPDGYSRMDRMSLLVHHLCKEWVTGGEYADRMNGLFRNLEAAILAAGPEDQEELIGRARQMENMFQRPRANETNSFAPWQQACAGFREALDRTENPEEIREILQALLTGGEAAVERNRYRNYKEIDAEIIRWLPWILSKEKIRTVWKLYAPDNMLANILSAIILRPAKLHILCADEDRKNVPEDAFRELLRRHGTGETEVLVSPVSSLTEAVVPAEPQDAADVTGCGEMQNRLCFPDGMRIVYFGNGDLQDKRGSPFFAPLYHPYDFALTVSEVFRLRGYRLLSDTQDNEMLGMEEDYLTLWEARKETDARAKDGRAWHYTVSALQKAEQGNRKTIYRKCDSRRQRFCYQFPPEDYDVLVRSGAIRVLYDLQAERCLDDVYVDPVKGEITCDIFPYPGEQEYYRETELALTGMLADRRENSRYAAVGNYAGDGKPCFFVNLEDPVKLDPGDLAGKVRQDALDDEADKAEKEARRQARLDKKRGYARPDNRGMLHSDSRPEQPRKSNVPDYKTILSFIKHGFRTLEEKGLLIPAGGPSGYRFKSPQVRRELGEEGFALETYVYYTLFLSGQFDDVRSNLRVWEDTSAGGNDLENELDILVTMKGRVGLISCKDTARFELTHIGRLRMQAEMYAVSAKPILVCSKKLDPDEDIVNADRIKLCKDLKVRLIRGKKVETDLVSDVMAALNGKAPEI